MKTEYDFSKAERGMFFRRSTDRRLPARPDQPRHWAGPDGQLSRFVRKKTDGKSVLEVTRSPEIFSLSGSFRFDQEFARTHIKEVVSAEHYPVLRIAEPLNPADEVVRDPELHEMMGWANNIVRLPLLPEAGHDLARQLREFPAVFLLGADHVRYLTLEDETADWSKELSLERSGTVLILDDGAEVARWKQVRRDPLVFERCSG